MNDPIDLDAHRPHEVSKMLCARCGHKWTAVHPVGTTGLECPNCHEMEGQQMSDIVNRLRKSPPSLGFEEYDPTFDVRQEAASRIEALEQEVAQLKAASREIRNTHTDQTARVRDAEVKAERHKNWNDAYQLAITGLRADVEKLRAALKQIAEGERDGRHCALIAIVALEGDKQ